ncbi:MAG TPA: hypothetical protein VGL00_06795 [Terracidiphilus sp.]|jgi:hypothetical protein
MRGARLRFFLFAGLIAAALSNSLPLHPQQDSFRWMDFHSAKDQDVIVWVTRSLEAEKWSSIREIGVIYDAALVVTTLRTNPQASPGSDTFNLWSASLTTHALTPLLKGVNLRWLDWMQFSGVGPPELGAIYDDCSECAASTYFTALYYDRSQHIWNTHWMRGGQAVPIWTTSTPEGVSVTRVYAILAGPDGRELVGTWNHFDYGKAKPAEDFVYRYDLDPFSNMERMLLLGGKEAEAMKQRLCSFQGTGAVSRGQDSALCEQTVHVRPERRPTLTPPRNNEGRSVPPGSHR